MARNSNLGLNSSKGNEEQGNSGFHDFLKTIFDKICVELFLLLLCNNAYC